MATTGARQGDEMLIEGPAPRDGLQAKWQDARPRLDTLETAAVTAAQQAGRRMLGQTGRSLE